MNRIFINNVNVSEDVTNLDEVEFEIGFNEATKTVTKSVTTSIFFKGETYELINDTFFRSCNSFDQELKGYFHTDLCGGVTIPFVILANSVEINKARKEAEVNLLSDSIEENAYNKLDSTYFFENGFAETNDIPIAYYCDQPNFLQYVLLLARQILAAATIKIRLVADFFEAAGEGLCEVLSLGLGNCDIGSLDPLDEVFRDFDNFITGNGRWGTAPLVREILAYQASVVGLSFQSSVLNNSNSKRFNLGLFCLEGGKRGSRDSTTKAKRIEMLRQNAPLWTTIQLLDELKEVFVGCDYRIIDGVLYFEPEQFFYNRRTVDIASVIGECDQDITYSYDNASLPAFGEFSYSNDQYDGEGNQTIATLYSDKVEYNDPYTPALKGKKSIKPSFGGVRFMFDTESYNKSGLFDFEKSMDKFRNGSQSFLGQYFGNNGYIRFNDIVLGSNQLGYPKLIAFNNTFFDRNDAKAIRKEFARDNSDKYYYYNYPMYFKKDLPDVIQETELINEFGYIVNPRIGFKKIKVSDYVMNCSCDVIKGAVFRFQDIYLNTHFGKAVPESIQVKITKKNVEITFKDSKVYCQN